MRGAGHGRRRRAAGSSRRNPERRRTFERRCTSSPLAAAAYQAIQGHTSTKAVRVLAATRGLLILKGKKD